MTKKCARCDLVLDQSKFNWKYKYTRLASYCKECSRAYIKSHYDNNQKYYVEKAKKRTEVYRKEGHEYIGNYLASHPCVDCGETDIVVLEFDHKERAKKKYEVSSLVRRGHQLADVIDEIEKCEVRCANCHRRKTAMENKSWKLTFLHS